MAIVAVCLSIWARSPVDLKFVELSSPKGFRSLVLNAQSSGFDPLFAVGMQTAQKQSGQPLALCETLYHDSSSPELGDRQAKVSIAEFFDYRCPYCKVLKDILDQVRIKQNVRVIYKEWPILSEGSKLAARAALAAVSQGKYMAFHSQLMNARLLTTPAYVKHLAVKNTIDPDTLFRDMQNPRISAALQRNAALAHELGIVGTPALVVGRTIVQGAISQKQLERLIDLEADSTAQKMC